jgi:peptide/nickel transport system permease protein
VTSVEVNIEAISSARSANVGLHTLRQLRRWPVVPVLILAVLITMAVFAPLLTSHNPRIGDLSDQLVPPFWLEGGSAEFFLGTDGLGRDLWTRLVFGARVSLAVAVVALTIGLSVGVTLGLIAGYIGGLIDELIMRLVDMTLAIPLIFVALVIVVVFGQSLSLLLLLLALFTWNGFARQVRGETLQLKESGYVALAKVAGASVPRILIRHILPGVASTVLVIATLRVPQLILTEAVLSFLGAGVPPPTPSWGAMVSDGRAYIASAWWIAFWPGVAMLLTVIAFNFLGDWLRDRLDPRLRQL